MKKKNIYDKNDIKHFDKLCYDWWNENGSLKTLHSINPIRLQYIKDITEIKGKNILDIGCGGGILSFSMAKNGANVVGIDPSKKLINIASNHTKKFKYNLKFLHMTMEDYIEKIGNKFDIITCMELIEHIKDPVIFVKMIKMILKRNGKIFFSTINRNINSYIKAIFLAEYIFNIIPRGTHNFKKFIKPSELNNILNKINCNMVHLQGFNYNPINNKTVFCKNTDLNYLAYFQHEPL
jgi:2-polyprenyl-6-hydroxyphenyl methylase/3-demethylubiquinone-9 3-methyltransferase